MKPDNIAEAWSAFVHETVNGLNLTNKEIADRVGISDTMLGNWMRAENFTKPNADNVVAFAREFGVPIPKALLAGGVIEAHEFTETVVVRRDVSEMSVDDMVGTMMQMLDKIRDVAGTARDSPETGRPRKRRPKLRARDDMPGL